MALKIECDRCGKQASTNGRENPNGWSTLSLTTSGPVVLGASITKTFCPNCDRDARRFCDPLPRAAETA
jgi:hypothetical protein